MKKFIAGFLAGALLFSGITAVAVSVAFERSNWKFFVDGEPAEIDAYNIDGSNYLKLRDVMEIADLGVWFDAGLREVYVERGIGYDKDYEGPGQGSSGSEIEESADNINAEEVLEEQKSFYNLTMVFEILGKRYCEYTDRYASIIVENGTIYFNLPSIITLLSITENTYKVEETTKHSYDGEINAYVGNNVIYDGETNQYTLTNGNTKLVFEGGVQNTYYKTFDGSNYIDMQAIKELLHFDFSYSIDEINSVMSL